MLTDELLSKIEALSKKRKGYRWLLENLNDGIQNIHTPFTLCKEIIGKLGEYCVFKNKEILVLFNLEFVDVLINDFGILPSQITFASDSDIETLMAKNFYGIPEVIEMNIEGKGKEIVAAIKKQIKKQFDVVVMNPPYQVDTKENNVNKSLWPQFVDLSLQLVKEGGFVANVHPAQWRGLGVYSMLGRLQKKAIKYLEIHSEKDGNRVFGCNTRYDWYVMQNSQNSGETTIVDEEGIKSVQDIRNMPFIPNRSITRILKLLPQNGEKTCDVLFDTQYHITKKYVSETECGEFKYPCVYSMNQDGVFCRYSSTKSKGHFGVAKVILSIGRHPYPFFDKGEYGMTQNAFAIIVGSQQEGDNIVKAVCSEEFKSILDSTK